MKEKMAIWVWHCDSTHGGFLFIGNPNMGLPQFHLGGILNMLCGERIVWEPTRKALEMNADILFWNERFPDHKVKPKQIMVDMKPYYYKRKEGNQQ